MGQLARSEIVVRGLRIAGNDSLTELANGWLSTWLDKVYASWPWPFLHRRASGISLPAGTTALTVGAIGTFTGSQPLATVAIRQIRDPIWLYSSTYSVAGKARVRALTGGPIEQDETVNNPVTNIGQPEQFKVRFNATPGQWVLIPTPVPDKAYLLAFDYLIAPQHLGTSTTDDPQLPVYPNDETMIAAVVSSAYEYMKRPESGSKKEELAAMVINDRVRFGAVDGTNDILGLDGNVFI